MIRFALSCLPVLAMAGLVLTGIPAAGQVAAGIREVPVVTFPTERGTVYQLEGSFDGEEWKAVGEPLFGDGSTASGTLPDGTPRYSRWRVTLVDPASLGIAPVSLADRTVILNELGRMSEVVFLDATRGLYKSDELHARTFVYSVRKSAPDVTVADLEISDGSTAVVRLAFTAAAAGRYEFEQATAEGAGMSRDAGVFSVHAGRIRQSNSDAQFPPSLVGRTLVIQEGPSVVTLQIEDDSQAIVTRSGSAPALLPFSYDLKDNQTAVLDVGRRSGRSGTDLTRYELCMESPAGGISTGQIMQSGKGGLVPADIAPDVGGFNIPFDPVTFPAEHAPPATIGGKTFLVSGSNPFILVFNHDGTGSILRERDGTVEQTPFLYDYDPTGDDGAKVTVTFPGEQEDIIEEYDVTFDSDNSGTFTQSQYENGERKSSEAGSFGPVASSGGGGGIVRPPR